ncbi:hypothetical protein [Streptomyces sp. AK02-04a]|uniref:hypothetical protein n=1 Tax=Streptomyces sp. AK02-04a TaxID=3028649 RepID=UPI0029A275CB|nr:hypothetical protein [Streptomyces sp. AK02-04a]MDX3763771.1 hypothetical protein [Streptomyces sp. AK02-04a]
MTNARTSTGVVVAGGVYNYVPSVLQDGVYRMWWCGSDPQHPGDHVFYAESSSLNGPFHARGSSAPYESVFSPTHADTFDGLHTCDPSVIRVNGVYYMYYGGSLGKVVHGKAGWTTIGLAVSHDGIHWARANKGRPIITPALRKNTGNHYGAGQPTVSYRDGLFYLMYTDSTGAASATTGAAQYVLRSRDPNFRSGVQELTATGFRPRTAAFHTGYKLAPYFSVDMQYSDALDSWIVAHSDGPNSRLSFFAPDFSSRTFRDVKMPRNVVEGPGLVSRPDRHSVAPTAGRCGVVPVDIINAVTRSTTTAPTALKHQGVNVSAGQTCSSMAPEKAARIFDGYALMASNLPLAFITGGRRLQSVGIHPIQDVTKNFIATTRDAFQHIPYGASLSHGSKAIAATGRPAAFLLDHSTKWPVNSIKIITDNRSSLTKISMAQYDHYQTGPALHQVQ